MKIRILIVIALSAVISNTRPAMAQNSQAKITLHLITDEGQIIKKFPCGAGSWKTNLLNPNDNTASVDGITDENGNATFTLPCSFPEVTIGTKYNISGFYRNEQKYHFTNVVSGKLQPWNPTVDVVVKPILNPIAMYAKIVTEPKEFSNTLQETNTTIGFDLEAGDWVSPYGKGNVSDFIFTMKVKTPYSSMTQPYDAVWTLSFTNKGDGIQSLLVPKNVGSAMRLPRYAPEGGYQPTLVQEISYDGKQWTKGAVGENQNYFFRVRTVLDASGKVKSALYGKIDGPIECAQVFRLQFTYYLNPTPNDRNMEFNPKKNLFQNLTDDQQVKAP